MRPRLLLAAAALVVAMAGCGADPLDPEVASAFVEGQAHALCLVQSEAFPTQADLEAAYREAEKSTGLSDEELAEARAAAENDVDLRSQVSTRVAALCG